ncbi:MAG: MBL fold metallo-hydrolase [Armatimonadetes bacterium]|nr:MBL fold metallo-hydrolase [Armatimonadota bacterium]
MNPPQGWTKLSEHLYLFPDICNVYAVKDGSRAVLVDFGTGKALEHLDTIGVSSVEWILHTHHHRDQCQGDRQAAEQDIRIAVPEHERRLFDQVELFWSNKQLFDMYNVRNTYFTLTESVPVAASLEDFSDFEWRSYRFFVLPAPGHTQGSISLLSEIDGKTVAFTGDLLYSPGKVVSLHDLQNNYGAVDGVEAAVLSLGNLLRRGPGLLCPSHGEPMAGAQDAIAKTQANLRSFYRFMSEGGKCVDELDLTPVTPRVLAGTYACAYFYVILSDSGKALFVDFGSPNFQQFQPCNRYFEDGERVRFMEHSLDRLKSQYGMKNVDVVMPSHYHDDHINGIPYLQNHLGARVWAFENMKEILENPRGEMIGCVLPTPIPVERTFADGDTFRWEEFEFTTYYTPGHCDYHMAMFATIDGRRIGFSGDNVWPPGFIPSLIYRNHVHRTSHQITAERFRQYRPEVLCTGHALHENVDPEGYDLFHANARTLTHHFGTLLPGHLVERGIEPSWIQIYPYQSWGSPGSVIDLTVRAVNPENAPSKIRVELSLPAGWRCDPPALCLEMAPRARAEGQFRATIPQDYVFRYPKVAIAADVSFNDVPLGQVTEAVVEYRSDSA